MPLIFRILIWQVLDGTRIQVTVLHKSNAPQTYLDIVYIFKEIYDKAFFPQQNKQLKLLLLFNFC